MKKVIILLLMVLLLVVFPLVGCSNSSGGVPASSGGVTTSLVGLVPEKANLVGQVDLSKILQDKALTGIYDKVPKSISYPQTFDDALAQLKDQYNIDLNNFQEGLFFSDISGSTDQGNYSGVIVEGTFNESDLIAAIQSAADVQLSTIKYKDYDIYTDELGETAIAFLGNTTIVIGAMQPVKDVIDVKKGDAKALSGEVLDTYNNLGDALIKVAMAVPPGAAEGNLGQSTNQVLGNLSALGQSTSQVLGNLSALRQSTSQVLGNLSAFDEVKTMGMAVSKNDDSVALNVKLCCADSDSAQSIEDSINGLISFMGLMMSTSGNETQNQTLNNLLNNVEVSRSDLCVNVSLSITVADIEDLIQSASQGSGQSG